MYARLRSDQDPPSSIGEGGDRVDLDKEVRVREGVHADDGDRGRIRAPDRERGAEPGVHVAPLDDVDVQFGDVLLRSAGRGEDGEDVAQRLLGLLLERVTDDLAIRTDAVLAADEH